MDFAEVYFGQKLKILIKDFENLLLLLHDVQIVAFRREHYSLTV
jgi:hypothetical protein